MKKILLVISLLIVSILLVSCGDTLGTKLKDNESIIVSLIDGLEAEVISNEDELVVNDEVVNYKITNATYRLYETTSLITATSNSIVSKEYDTINKNGRAYYYYFGIYNTILDRVVDVLFKHTTHKKNTFYYNKSTKLITANSYNLNKYESNNAGVVHEFSNGIYDSSFNVIQFNLDLDTKDFKDYYPNCFNLYAKLVKEQSNVDVINKLYGFKASETND